MGIQRSKLCPATACPVTAPAVRTHPVTAPAVRTHPVTAPAVRTHPVTAPAVRTHPAKQSSPPPHRTLSNNTEEVPTPILRPKPIRIVPEAVFEILNRAAVERGGK
jgi:hypothetical protein